MNITYKDSEGNELKYFTQWDINRQLKLTGITGNNVMIHFYNRLSSRALVVQPKKSNEDYIVNVPNILLQEPCDIMLSIFVENGEEGKTEEIFSIPVEEKTKPEDYTFEENIDYANWVELSNQAKELIAKAQADIKDIENKLASGEFKGEKGDKGDKGDTPVKGVDYWTEQDKAEVVNDTKVLIEDEIGNKVTLNIDENYVMTLNLLNPKNTIISTSKIDLPIESMIINATYANGIITLTLQNGNTIDVNISDLVNGLVNQSTFNTTIEEINTRITSLENRPVRTEKLTFTGAVTAEYDGTQPVTVNIPQGGASGAIFWNEDKSIIEWEE